MVIDVAGGAVDDATDGHPDRQSAPTVPATQVPRGAAGQCGQRGLLPPARGGGLHGVQRPAQQIGGDDAGRPRADVDGQGQVGLVVDLDRYPRAPDRTGGGQVGAFAQQIGVQQRGYLAVDRGDGQRGVPGDGVTGDRAVDADRAEDAGRSRFGDLQRRRDDVIAPQRTRPRGVGARGVGAGDTGNGGGENGNGGGAHGWCP